MCLPSPPPQLPIYSQCGSNENVNGKMLRMALLWAFPCLPKMAGGLKGLYVGGLLSRLSPSTASVIMGSYLLTFPSGNLDHWGGGKGGR